MGRKGMVGIELLIKISPDKRVEFLQAFDMLKQLDQLGDNRVDLELFEQIKEPNTFLWLEHWDNTESLKHYYQDNRYHGPACSKTYIFNQGGKNK